MTKQDLEKLSHYSRSMAGLMYRSPPASPSLKNGRKSFCRRLERCCCTTLTHFPLAFVYGLTTWAIWVEVSIAYFPDVSKWIGFATSALGILLYALANISYTVAVFTDPGSPLHPPSYYSQSVGYASLPTQEPDQAPVPTYTSFTAKSTGRPRFCKKCQVIKPDRAHHCSTCGRCVLKMDHHCPWLATCVGLRNYKAFLLFLIYTSLFCWVCFIVSAQWTWSKILDETQLEDGARLVNTILLAVVSGIIGLVLSGFTAWHIYLAMSGQTTIESLEKTRYLSPLRKSMEHQIQQGRHYVGSEGGSDEDRGTIVDQLKEIHANALPGVTRPEEGIEDRYSDNSSATPHQASYDSPARDSLRRTYAEAEEQRERERYAAYLDEQDSEKLPHAFNLGWRRNLEHLLGENRLLWPLPVCNTTGDGWRWEPSAAWVAASNELAAKRTRELQNRQQHENGSWRDGQSNGFAMPRGPLPNGAERHYSSQPPLISQAGNRPISQDHQDQSVALKTLNGTRTAGGSDEYDTSSDEDGRRLLSDSVGARPADQQSAATTGQWNDIPEDFLAVDRATSRRSRSRGRRKGD